jgi:hypothetical protein
VDEPSRPRAFERAGIVSESRHKLAIYMTMFEGCKYLTCVA